VKINPKGSPLDHLLWTFLGIATLLGWNAVLNSMNFYSEMYPNYAVSFSFGVPEFVA